MHEMLTDIESAKQPLVSAIVTTCKRPPKILKRAVKSVLEQTYSRMELIVVDDSPADYEERLTVKEMIDDMQKTSGVQIRYIQHQKNVGACQARNTGIAVSTGSYIAFLDDDDEWQPDKIEKLLPLFCNEKVAIAYADRIIVNDDTHEEKYITASAHNGEVYEKLILENFIGSTSFPLLKMSCVREVGAFDNSMESSQDYDLWLRLSQKYEVRYLPEGLTKYHIHNMDQISKDAEKIISGFERINLKNEAYLKSNKQAYWIRNICLVPMYANNRNLRKARKSWWGCVRKCPAHIIQNIKYCVWAFGLNRTFLFKITKTDRDRRRFLLEKKQGL